MGWSGGSPLMAEIIGAMREHVVDDGARLGVYRSLVRSFKDLDCDTLSECLGTDPAYDSAYELEVPSEGGYRAADRGVPESANPYRPGTEAAGEWSEGWNEYRVDHGGS